MSPRTPEQLKNVRESSRNRIKAAALKIFATQGYHTTSIDTIAKSADISKGLLYHYFNGKEDLLEKIMIEELEALFQTFLSVPLPQNPKKALEQLIHYTFDVCEGDMEYWKLYWSLAVQPDVPVSIYGKFTEQLAQMFSLMEALLSKIGYENPKTEARILGAALDGVFLHYFMDPEKFPAFPVRKGLIKKYCT